MLKIKKKGEITMTVEEIEIVVTEKVEEALKKFEKMLVVKESRLCFLSSFIDKEKNELYNRPSYHYGDR